MPYKPLQAPVDSGEIGTIYLICLERAFSHARHYLGWTRDFEHRIWHHRRGTGAHFLRMVNEAGIGWDVVRTWRGDRNRERQLKNRGGKAKLCPNCKARVVLAVAV